MNKWSGTVVSLFLTIAFMAGFAGCKSGKSTWTSDERQLIEEFQNQMMPLCVVDSMTDSLLLRGKCQAMTLEDVQDSLYLKLKSQMLLTVNNPDNQGVGIAAPQVGISRRLVAVQRLDKEGEPFEFYINPKLTFLSDEKREGWEGCLSVPGKRGKVERSNWLVVEYNDESTFELRTDTVRGFTAVIFQHETDHLDGILYIDRASELVLK